MNWKKSSKWFAENYEINHEREIKDKMESTKINIINKKMNLVIHSHSIIKRSSGISFVGGWGGDKFL